jgi:hypothetical protein
VVAEPRYVDAGDLAGLEHGEALGDPHSVPVHEHLERVLRVAGQLDARAAHRFPRPRQLRVRGSHSCAGLRRAGGGGRGDPAAGGGRCRAARRQDGLGAAQRPRDEGHGGGEAIGSRGGGRGKSPLPSWCGAELRGEEALLLRAPVFFSVSIEWRWGLCVGPVCRENGSMWWYKWARVALYFGQVSSGDLGYEK